MSRFDFGIITILIRFQFKLSILFLWRNTIILFTILRTQKEKKYKLVKKKSF